MIRILFIFLLMILPLAKTFAQWEEEVIPVKHYCEFKKDPFSIGVGGALNTFIFQLGHELRVTVPVSKYINVVGEYYHYGIRDHDTAIWYRFKELYFDLGLTAKVFQNKRWNIYLRAAYLFTQWTNEDDLAGPGNYNGMQMGLGAEYSFKYFSVFFENNTNTVWWELNSIAGIKINKFPRIFSKPKNRYGSLLREGI